MKKLIIFDMDGTLNDSSPGIVYCFRKTCEFYGKTDVTDDILRTGLSGPFTENLKSIIRIDDSQIPEAIDYYVRHYAAEGQSMAKLFPGVDPLLKKLKGSGYKLAVATHMAEEYAINTLKRESVFDYFDVVHGASFEIEYSKGDLIEQCLRSLNVSADDSVMVGDGVDDHQSAKGLGVDFIGAGYGYEIDQDYCMANGIPFLKSPEDLLRYL